LQEYNLLQKLENLNFLQMKMYPHNFGTSVDFQTLKIRENVLGLPPWARFSQTDLEVTWGRPGMCQTIKGLEQVKQIEGHLCGPSLRKAPGSKSLQKTPQHKGTEGQGWGGVIWSAQNSDYEMRNSAQI